MHGMVDALGGVDVVSNSTFSTDGYNFVKGKKVHLDGDKVLAFIRSRKEPLKFVIDLTLVNSLAIPCNTSC